MSTHPYIPLYVDDYDAHTAHLTPAQDGIYGRLLRLCWRTPGCSLPNDEAWIARKVRLNAADWQRIGKPVLDEFFTPSRGRLVQKRLKAEYDNISRKKSARVNAGKKGGEAKARKTQGKSASNATVLPEHTRAFPEPEPEEEKNPLNPQGGQATLDLVADEPDPVDEVLVAFTEWNDLARRLGLPVAQNLDETRRRPIRKRLEAGGLPMWRKALEAVEASAFLRGLRTGGDGRIFKADLTFVCQAKSFGKLVDGSYGADAPTPQAPRPVSTWNGPQEIWDAVRDHHHDGETFAASWLGRCTWVDADRAIVSTNGFVVETLRREVSPALARLGVRLQLEQVAA